MYKNRLAAWGLFKNVKRGLSQKTGRRHDDSRAVAPAEASRNSLSPEGHPPNLVAQPSSDHPEAVVLLLMTKIRDLGTAYYDAEPPSRVSSETPDPGPGLSEATISALQLATACLLQGYGTTAGRLVPKVFLTVEAMFHLDSPVFIWNILEMTYVIVSVQQYTLCELFLAHLASLAPHRHPLTHPLVQIFHGLRSRLRSGTEPRAAPRAGLGPQLSHCS